MKFSTRSEYGLRAIINIASSEKLPKSASYIAKEEHISLKYLERILSIMKTKGIIQSTRGAKGGYILSKGVESLTVGEIIISLEGPISLMTCEGKNCYVVENSLCHLRNLWHLLEKKFEKILFDVTLKDVLSNKYKM